MVTYIPSEAHVHTKNIHRAKDMELQEKEQSPIKLWKLLCATTVMAANDGVALPETTETLCSCAAGGGAGDTYRHKHSLVLDG